MNLRIAVIGLTFLLAANSTADLIPDHHKSIRSELLIEGMEHFPDMKFAIFPVHLGSQSAWRDVKSGEDIHFYHMVSPNLYALDAGAVTDAGVFQDPSTPRSDVPIYQVGSVPLSEEAVMIRRVYRITGIDGNHVALERQPDLRYDAEGKLIGPGPLAAVWTEAGNRKKFVLAGTAGAVVLLGVIIGRISKKRGISSGQVR